jgi:hypothetical protein
MLVIPALGRKRQKDHKFEDSLGYIHRECEASLDFLDAVSENKGLECSSVVENLPSIHKVLCSISSTTKEKM